MRFISHVYNQRFNHGTSVNQHVTAGNLNGCGCSELTSGGAAAGSVQNLSSEAETRPEIRLDARSFV